MTTDNPLSDDLTPALRETLSQIRSAPMPADVVDRALARAQAAAPRPPRLRLYALAASIITIAFVAGIAAPRLLHPADKPDPLEAPVVAQSQAVITPEIAVTDDLANRRQVEGRALAGDPMMRATIRNPAAPLNAGEGVMGPAQPEATRLMFRPAAGGQAGAPVTRAEPVPVPPPPVPLPAAAQEVLRQLEQDQAKALDEMETKLAPARRAAIAQLQLLQDRYTKAGQLDEAIAIRDRVRALKAELGGDPADPLADPGNLLTYRGHFGKTYYFKIIATTQGRLWGTSIYTDDSPIAAAAVHAGLLKPGQESVVRVTLVPPRTDYVGTAQNGLSSEPYNIMHPGYRIELAPGAKINDAPTTSLPDPGTLTSFRARVGQSLLFEVTGITPGPNTPPIWGDTLYTDDSPLAAVVVHAGILAPGQRGLVRVTVLPAQPGYNGASRNGIDSQPYGPWDGSYSVEKAPLQIK